MMFAILRAVAGFVFSAMGVGWTVLLLLQGVLGLATMRSDAGEFKTAVISVLQSLSEASPLAGYGISAVLVFIGVLLLFWHPHRDLRSKVSPQLYLTNWAPGQTGGVKSYLASWSPKEYFSFKFYDHAGSNSLDWPLPDTAEKCFTFHLLNAGPGPVRHIRAAWSIRADIPTLIKASSIFEGFVRRLTRHCIALISESGAIDRPSATKQKVALPVLADGELIRLESPAAFTTAVIIYALSEARRLSTSRPPQIEGLSAAMEYWESVTAPMRPINITLTYETDDRTRITQRFRVTGSVHGNVATMTRGTEENAIVSVEGGTTAWIDHINVVSI